MARGQSPYQGRYTVPIADFSPIAQSGRDIGAAFASIGSSVASGLTKRKEEKDALKAIEGKTKGLNTAIQGFGGLIDAGAFSDDEELNASLKQQIESLNNAINKNPDITPREKLGILEGGMPLLLKGLGLVTDKSKVALAAVLDEGVYPNSLALDTTFFLICAVSKNISDATMLALNADVCAEYANKSTKKDKLEPSKS